MRCEQIMSTDVACCLADESVEQAARRMRARNVGFLPVLDAQSRLIGAFTDRDLVLRVVAEGLPPRSTPVGAVMSTGLVWVHPSDPVELAAERMMTFKKSRIVCVDVEGDPLGVISLADIADAEAAPRSADPLRDVASRETSH